MGTADSQISLTSKCYLELGLDIISRLLLLLFLLLIAVQPDNSTKSPASGAGNVRESRLMSQVGRVREVVCAQVSVFLRSERLRCQCSSAYVAAAVTGPRQETCWVCETRAERCHAKMTGYFVDVILLYVSSAQKKNRCSVRLYLMHRLTAGICGAVLLEIAFNSRQMEAVNFSETSVATQDHNAI